MRIQIFLTLAIFILMSCTPKINYWNKPGAYMEEVAYEKKQCMIEAMEKAQGNWVAYEAPCMVSKGYVLGRTPPPPAGKSYNELKRNNIRY